MTPKPKQYVYKFKCERCGKQVERFNKTATEGLKNVCYACRSQAVAVCCDACDQPIPEVVSTGLGAAVVESIRAIEEVASVDRVQAEPDASVGLDAPDYYTPASDGGGDFSGGGGDFGGGGASGEF